MTDGIKPKKPLWKKWWLWLGALIVIIVIASAGSEKEEKETKPVVQPPSAQEQEQPEQISGPEIKAYDIQFTAEHLGGKEFKVSGSTDLPDGAKVGIEIQDKDYYDYDNADPDWRLENLTYISRSTRIMNNEFNETIKALDVEAPLTSDKYEVIISFNPRSQTERIKKIVGENGEYLSGNFIDKSIEGLTMLEASKLISLKEEIPYKIIDEEDISYLGCKRVGIRIVVPDNSNKTDVDYVLEKIINDNKSEWDDITVWAYKYSEEEQVGKIPHTMGTKEYSVCE